MLFFLYLIRLSPCIHAVTALATESDVLQVWFISHLLTDTH